MQDNSPRGVTQPARSELRIDHQLVSLAETFVAVQTFWLNGYSLA